MQFNSEELEAIKELIYLEIDKRNGIDNIDPDLNTALWKIININNMNRIEQLIENRYPGQLNEILDQIEDMKLDYDTDQFLEEDIQESILIELNVI